MDLPATSLTIQIPISILGSWKSTIGKTKYLVKFNLEASMHMVMAFIVGVGVTTVIGVVWGGLVIAALSAPEEDSKSTPIEWSKP